MDNDLQNETPEEIKESILGAEEAPNVAEFTSDEKLSDIEQLAGSTAAEPKDDGPSDEQVYFEERYTADDQEWLSQNPDVEGLVEPKTADDIRANVRVVKEARDRDLLDEELGLAASQNALNTAVSAWEAGYEPEEILRALAEGHPEQVIPFVQTWGAEDEEAAVEALSDLVKQRGERYQNAQLAAEAEEAAAIEAAWNKAADASGLTEAGVDLVRRIVETDPARVIGLNSPEEAKEVFERTVAEAREIRRAEEESSIKSGIMDAAFATELDRGWGVAGDDDQAIEPNWRSIHRPTETVGAMKKALLEDSAGDEMEAFKAANWTPPRSEFEYVRDGGSKRRAR